MDKSTILKIKYEISEIDELLEKASVLINLCQNKEPDFIELSAAGATLQWEKCSHLLLGMKDFWINLKLCLLNVIQDN